MSEAWDRRLKLLAYLMRRGFAQTAEAAHYLGAEKRTVREDFKALCDNGVPLRAEPEDDTRNPDRTWELEKSWRMAGLEVKLDERLALLLGKEVLEPLLGASDIGSAMAKLDHQLASVAEAVETSDRELLRRFHLIQEPSKDYADQGQRVSDLVQAIAMSYRVTIDYQSPGKAVRTHTRVRPVTLAIYRRGLYVFVIFDNDKIGPISVDRIAALEVHFGDGFDYPARNKWDPAVHLRKRFGLRTGQGKPETVRLRFPAESKAYALERTWMQDQRVEVQADGAIDIVFEAEGSELPYRVLEWGGYCEVIEPATLRAKVLELAQAVIARHQPR